MRLTLMQIAALAVSLAACGGSSSGSETTADKLAGAPPPVLPLPTDPWAIVPESSSVLTVDIAAVRGSAQAPFLRELAQSFCISPEQAQLFDKTERVIGAGNKDGGLITFKGRYTDAELQLVFDRFAAAAKSEGPMTEQMYKRIRILRRGDFAGARIGDDLIVVGAPAHVEKAAALAEGEKVAPLMQESALFTRGGVRADIATHTAVLAGLTSEMKMRRISNGLGAVGLPPGIFDGTIVATLNLTASGAEVSARITKESAQVAAGMASAIQRKLGQLSLLARLAGLPPILEKTEAEASDAELHNTLSASNADIEALRGRLTEELAESPPCAP